MLYNIIIFYKIWRGDRVKFMNLGPIKSGEIELNNLTIFCGRNNQGKTYVSYALYGIIDTLSELVNDLFSGDEINYLIKKQKMEYEKSIFIDRISKKIYSNFEERKRKILKRTFRVEEDLFNDTDINISIEEIRSLLINHEKVSEMQANISKEVTINLKFDDRIVSIIFYGDLEKTSLDNDDISHILDEFIRKYVSTILSIFYIPAERIGLNVFRTQLNESKLDTLDAMSSLIQFNNIKGNISKNDFRKETLQKVINVFSEQSTSYPKPINDYLKYINAIDIYGTSEENESASFIREKILNGKFNINSSNNQTFFRLKYGNKRYKKDLIPIQVTSSSIKSMYGLDHLLDHIDKYKKNFILIDEPEMNLHPENQLQVAELLNKMIQSGLNIIISTHSDFLLRKVQNLILKNQLDDLEGLNEKNVSLYEFKDRTINKINILEDDVIFDNFNSTIEMLENEYLDLIDEIAIRNSQKEDDDIATR